MESEVQLADLDVELVEGQPPPKRWQQHIDSMQAAWIHNPPPPDWPLQIRGTRVLEQLANDFGLELQDMLVSFEACACSDWWPTLQYCCNCGAILMDSGV